MGIKLSFSKISTYIECPRKYFLSYICNLGTGKSPHMTNGTIIHKCCEDFVDWAEKDKTFEKLTEYYFTLVPQIDKDNLVHENFQGDMIVHPSFENKALKSLKSFYEDYMDNAYDAKNDKKGNGPERGNNTRPNVILQEQWFNLPIGNGHEIRGLIDRVDEESPYKEISEKHSNEHIIDYKSGQTRATFKALQDPLDIKSMQLSIYALARLKQTGKIPHKVSFFYVEPSKGAKKQVGQYRSASRTEEELKKVEQFLGGIANEIEKAIEEKNFPIGDSPNCFFCDFKNQCEILAEQQITELNNKINLGEDTKVEGIDNSIWEE